MPRPVHDEGDGDEGDTSADKVQPVRGYAINFPTPITPMLRAGRSTQRPYAVRSVRAGARRAGLADHPRTGNEIANGRRLPHGSALGGRSRVMGLSVVL